MDAPEGAGRDLSGPESSIRAAEHALRRMGYARVAPQPSDLPARRAQFWVQEPGVPRRVHPVFVDAAEGPEEEMAGTSAILVVPDEHRARAAYERLRRRAAPALTPEVAILVLRPDRARGDRGAYWHSVVVDRRELLAVATGVVVGLFRRAQSGGETGQVDFEEMLQLLKGRFHLDVEASLGVGSAEDALWMMYQLALRHAYAPGDPSGNLHLLVLKPTGPSARLPWFAA